MDDLTPRQAEILALIQEYIYDEGYQIGRASCRERV